MKEIITRVRTALERIDKSDMPLTFADFPLGSCGDTYQLLAEILIEEGYSDLYYVAGFVEHDESIGHAWLEFRATVIDITSDQFQDRTDSVYIGPKTDWYNFFIEDERSIAGISQLHEPDRSELYAILTKVKSQMSRA